VIQRASGFQSPKSIAAWYRTHPRQGEAQRPVKSANGAAGAPGSNAAASAVDGPASGGGGSSVETVRFPATDLAVRRDKAILKAAQACRSGLLAPAVALRDSLQACAAFTAELGQRVVCYSLIDRADLQTLRDLKPWLHSKGERGTREFDYVQRVVMGGESCATIIVGRSTVLYERSALPLRALEFVEAAGRPFRESNADREDRQQRLRSEATRLVEARIIPAPSGGGSGAERAEQVTRARADPDRPRPDRA